MMTTNTYFKRGGMIRGLAWMAAALGAALLVTALFAYRGARIQREIQEGYEQANTRLREKFPQVPELPEIPTVPALPTPAEDDPTKDGSSPASDVQPAPAKSTGPAKTSDPQPKSGGEVEPPAPEKPAYTVKDPPPIAKARHKVAKGETLYSLAETYYEDGSLWKIIAEANSLKEPADLREGMVVVIPGKR
jgi:nucleoid-associated protein YgaU